MLLRPARSSSQRCWPPALSSGLLEARWPGWSQPVPSLGVLLGVMLAVDLSMQRAAMRGRIDPLAMPYRAAAFFAAALVVMGVPALLR